MLIPNIRILLLLRFFVFFTFNILKAEGLKEELKACAEARYKSPTVEVAFDFKKLPEKTLSAGNPTPFDTQYPIECVFF